MVSLEAIDDAYLARKQILGDVDPVGHRIDGQVFDSFREGNIFQDVIGLSIHDVDIGIEVGDIDLVGGNIDCHADGGNIHSGDHQIGRGVDYVESL